MGTYVNPPGEDKMLWLADNGSVCSETPTVYDSVEGNRYVCLVDNGAFTAGGVAVDQRELAAFSLLTDHRPKMWFSVPIERLQSIGAY